MSAASPVTLRDMSPTDLAVFFEHQREPEALDMAAFTMKDPSDIVAFNAHWNRLLSDPNMTKKTILQDGVIAGHIIAWEEDGQLEITYWIGREYWGRGVASRALADFLGMETTRPVRARVAIDNVASLRVLQKCGFITVGRDRGFANARGREIEEMILMLT